MKRTKFFCATLFTVFALLALFSCSNLANTGTPGSLAKSRGAKIINVTYDANGGGQLKKSVYDYALGNPIGTEMPFARRAGYIFTGWNTKANGTGDVFNKNTILTDSITVYAQWTFKSTPFTLSIDYSKAEVTIANYDSLPDTATVALTNSALTITATPLPVETQTYDFMGYYDADGVRISDRYGNLIPNTPYADVYGKWSCDLDYEGINLVIYPRWFQNIKATSVTIDQATYNVIIGDTFTVTGHYEPANATTTITNPFENYSLNNSNGVLLTTKDFVCNNGTFSIEFKALKPFYDTFTFSCVKYPSTSAVCSINVQFPNAATLAALPSVSAVSSANSTNDGPAIGNSSSNYRYDFTGYDFDSDSDSIYKLYKVNLTANKKYFFEMSDSCSTTVDGIENYIDACVYIFDQYGNHFDFYSGKNYLDNNDDYFIPFTTDSYYIMLSRLSVYEQYEGYAGFHIYLNCATDISLNVQNDYDQSRYDSFTGTYKLKPFETLNLDVDYDYKCENEPVVWPEASIFNTSIISLDDTNIAPADGGYITLTANKIGSTDLVVSDNYSGSGIHYFVSCDIDESFTTFDTASSTDYSDYTEMLFSPGLESVKWYKLSLTGGHRYAFETGNNVTEIVNAIGTPNRTYVDLYIYDSDFNLLTRNVEFFPCQETGDYYIQFRPDQNDRKNAFHVYDMGVINTSIALSSDNLNLNVGNSTTIAITFNNGGTALSSDFTCYFADGVENDNTDLTRFASVTPYDDSSAEITISGVPYGEFSFSDVPSTLTVKGLVPGKTKLILRDDNAGIHAELNITVTASSIDDTLALQAGPVDEDTTNLSDFKYSGFNESKLYTIYSATLKEGVKYYFQTLDEENVYLIANDFIDAHFYLLNSAYNIVAFSDSTQIIDYTCPASGTYYFVITYRYLYEADSDTYYAGVRWYAEKITSMSDYLTSSQYFFLDADGLTHNITNDFQYTPTNAYYNFIVSNTEDSRIVGNATVANSTRLRLNPYMPGTTYVTVLDKYSGVEHNYKFMIFPTEASSEIPVLPISGIPLTPDDSTEIYNLPDTVVADLSSKKYEIYSMQLNKDEKYHFLLADNDEARGLTDTSDCYFYIENSKYDIIVKADNGSSDRGKFLNFTCPESGTYYFVIARYSMGTTGATTAGAVYAYSNTISLTDTPLGLSKDINIPFSTSSGTPDFEVKADINDPTWNYTYLQILNFDDNSKLPVTGNKVTIEMVKQIEISNYCFYEIPLIVTDNNTSTTEKIKLHIAPNQINVIPDTSPASLETDFYVSNLSDDMQYSLYEIQLEADKTYHFEIADSYSHSHDSIITLSQTGDCLFYLYDSSLNTLIQQDDNDFSYPCSLSGKYYLKVFRRSAVGTIQGAFHVYVD